MTVVIKANRPEQKDLKQPSGDESASDSKDLVSRGS